MDKIIDFISSIDAPTLVSMAVMLWLFTRDIKKDIKKDIEKQNAILDSQNARIDSQNARIDSQSKRIDRLYEMFYEVQQEIKEIYKSWGNHPS